MALGWRMPDSVIAGTRIQHAPMLHQSFTRQRRAGPFSGSTSFIRRSLGCTSLAIGACLPLTTHAQSANLSGTVALSSQLVDRGLPVTRETPIVQGAVAWASPQGWSLRLSASAEARRLDRLTETFAQAAHYWTLAPDWQMGANLSYYVYPSGPRQARAYDRVEAGLGWVYRDVLTFGLSAIHGVGPGDRRLRGAADVSFHWPLPRHFGFSAGAGIAQAKVVSHGYYRHGYEHDQAGSYEYGWGSSYYTYTRWNAYRYGHIGLTWTRDSWHLELDRILTSGYKRSRDSLDVAPWVATISLSF